MNNILFSLNYIFTINHYIKFEASNYFKLEKRIVQPIVLTILYRFMLEYTEDDTNNIYDKFYEKLLKRKLYQHIFSVTKYILFNILKEKFIKEQREFTIDSLKFLHKLFDLKQVTINTKQIQNLDNLYTDLCKQNNSHAKKIFSTKICSEMYILFFSSCRNTSIKDTVLSHKTISFLLDFQANNYHKLYKTMQNNKEFYEKSNKCISFDQNKELNGLFIDADYFERFLIFIFIKMRDSFSYNVKITDFSVKFLSSNIRIFNEQFLKSFQDAKEDFFEYLIYFVNFKKDITILKINKDVLFFISEMHENIFLHTVEFYLKINLPTFEDATIENFKSLFLLVDKEIVEEVVDIICKNFINPLILKCQKLKEMKISIYKFD